MSLSLSIREGLSKVFRKRGRMENRPKKHDPQTYWERMHPLGDLRCRILACMFADNPKVPAYFNPATDVPLKVALQQHLHRLLSEFGSDTESRLIFAAGLLTFGRLTMADVILQQLPDERIVLDHGAGWCRVLPYRVVATLLPVPEELSDPAQWIEGTPQAHALRSWFAGHKGHWRWDDTTERFVDSCRQATE